MLNLMVGKACLIVKQSAFGATNWAKCRTVVVVVEEVLVDVVAVKVEVEVKVLVEEVDVEVVYEVEVVEVEVVVEVVVVGHSLMIPLRGPVKQLPSTYHPDCNAGAGPVN